MILDKLFKSIKIGELELKNRIFMPAMHTHLADHYGSVTDQLIAHYAERAKGGVGLIIVEMTGVDSTGQGLGNQLMLEKDERIEGISRLVERIKKEGARVGIQLAHAGLRANTMLTKSQPLGPSKLEAGAGAIAARELSDVEIKELIENFCKAARRAKDSGFDFVELHCAHGYLLNEFLSPFYNKRSDAYGGTQGGRTELICQIVRVIRKTVGRDYPILCKIPGDEGRENGIKIEDAILVAKKLEEVGVNAIEVSCGFSEMFFPTLPMGTSQGAFVHLAHEIKKNIHTPVMTVGRIKDPILANLILKEEKADLIGMGRALIADPYIPKKALQGKLEEIRPCIGCNWCITQIGNLLPILCAVNPLLGREDGGPSRITGPKRILVAGGGPAGMETAIHCAKKGHDVVLIERANHLGGLMRVASIPPQKNEINDFTEYLLKELARVGVQIKMGEEVTSEVVRRLNPDAIVVATGSGPIVPEVSGYHGKNVVMALDILQGIVKPGQNVLIIGGGQVGLEVADYLSDQGITVTVVEQLPQVGTDIPPRVRIFLLERLIKKKVKLIVEAKAIEIKENGVLLELPGRQEIIAGDQVIISVGMRSRHDLIEDLNKNFPNFKNIYIVGDAIEPRGILEAVRDGYEVSEVL